MKVNGPFPAAILAAGLFLFTGCSTDSVHPLADPSQAKPEPGLVGLWRGQVDNGQVAYCHVGRVDGKLPSCVLRVVALTHNKGKLEGPLDVLTFPTTFGSKHYLNILCPAEGTEQQVKALEEKGWTAEAAYSYYFYKYELQGDKLTLWGLDRGAVGQLVQSGKVKGEVNKNDKSGRFTDTTEKLAHVVAEGGDNLFEKKPIEFERVVTEKKP